MMHKKEYNRIFGGGGNAAETYDSTDSNSGDNMIDIPVGNNTYSIPAAMLKNVGVDSSNPKESYQSRAYMAGLYAAYRISTGKDLSTVATEAGYDRTWAQSWDVMTAELKRWYKEESGEELNVPSNWESKFYNELTNPNKSLQSNFDALTNSGAVKINGSSYKSWKQSKLGDVYGKDSTGGYIYKNAAGKFVDSNGNEVTDFTGATDISGNPVSYNGLTGNLETPDGIEIEPAPSNVLTKEDAFNQYYTDLFSQKDGTLGKQILDNNISLYEKEAENALVLAEGSKQAQALSQGQSIKQITDQLRSERMAQLRAGMSESQLADRELQMLMSTTTQQSGQALMANQEATAAQLAKTTAKEQAFNDYLASTTALGQNAAANYASQAGDLITQAQNYQALAAKQGRVITLSDALNEVSGNKTTGGN